MESDPEGVPWLFELLTERTEVIDGYTEVPTTPAWRCDRNDDTLKKYASNK